MAFQGDFDGAFAALTKGKAMGNGSAMQYLGTLMVEGCGTAPDMRGGNAEWRQAKLFMVQGFPTTQMPSLNRRVLNDEIDGKRSLNQGGDMRYTIHLIMALVIALTCWPTDGFAQSHLWRQQQRMQQENMRRQQEMQRQQREAQRRQQEAQRRQMEEQRRRQQAAMQQRQREMQVRKQQMQAQRQKMAEQRQLQQQKRQQEMQRKQAQRQQVAQRQAQQTARIARDRALQLQRERRLQELRKRTRLQQQEQQRQKAAQQTSTIALLSRTTNRASVVNSQNFAQRRQEAARRFAKLRASRPVAAAAGGAGSGGKGNNKAIMVANKQFQQQKLQEFRNRQALKGAKETKQDAKAKLPIQQRPAFMPGSVGAAKAWTKKGTLKYHQLPTTGKIRFVPPKNWNPTQDLPRGPNKGIIDRFGNEWTKGPSRTKGQSFEWDVQLSRRGLSQLGHLSSKKTHLNVSLDGKVTH